MQLQILLLLFWIALLCTLDLFKCNRFVKNNTHIPQSKLVIFSFDGFRHDYVNANDTPNLYELAKNGVMGHMRSSMVTKTYPNHQSIATGLYQPIHGVINNQFIDPLTNTSFNPDEPSHFMWDMFNRSVPLYIANQLYDPSTRFSGAMQWPGSIVSYTDGTGRNDSNRITIHYLQEFDESMNMTVRIDRVIDWLTSPVKPANVAFLYYHEPDTISHEYGPFSRQVNDMVKALDADVGYFMSQLKQVSLSSRTNVIFLSDHGMAEIDANRGKVFHLDQCDKKFPGLSYRIHGSSPVYSILPISGPKHRANSSISSSLAASVRDALNQCAEELFSGQFKVYLQADIPAQFNYGGNRRILDLFLLADDGCDVIVGDNGGWHPSGYPIYGMHGYNNSLPSMRPLFIANGPGFKQTYTHKRVFDNVDLYPMMLQLIAIPRTQFPSNGSFENVMEMLTGNVINNGANRKTELTLILVGLHAVCLLTVQFYYKL